MRRRQQTNMPLTIGQLRSLNQKEITRVVQRRDKEIPKVEEYKSIRSKTLDELTIGKRVLVKHHKSGRWDTEATVTQQREDKLSYVIKDNNGRTFIRGQRLLKPVPNHHFSDRVLRSHKKPKEKEKEHPQHTEWGTQSHP